MSYLENHDLRPVAVLPLVGCGGGDTYSHWVSHARRKPTVVSCDWEELLRVVC
jgi:hypothetical protein